MKELIAAFLQKIQEIKNQANAMLSGLPPLEQFEAQAEISYGIRALQRYGNELMQTAENLENGINEMVNKVSASATATAEAALLEQGLHILKTDAQAALDQAVALKEQAVRAEIQATAEKNEKIAVARRGIVASKELPPVVAERLDASVFDGNAEEVTARVGAVKSRLERLKGLGFQPVGTGTPVVVELCSLPVDEAGEARFASRLLDIQSLTAGSGETAPINPGAGAGAGGAGGRRYTTQDLV